MRKLPKNAILIFFSSLVVLFLVVGLLKNDSPRMTPETSMALLKAKEEYIQRKIQMDKFRTSEKLWVLAVANIRSGPGKDFEIIGKLKLFEKVEVLKDDSTEWRKFTYLKGYVHRTLVGKVEDMRKTFLKQVDKFTQTLMDAGVIVRLDGWTIYVDRYAWIEIGEMTRTPFVRNYGAALKIKQKRDGISVDIVDYYSGRRILSYKVDMDLFFMN